MKLMETPEAAVRGYDDRGWTPAVVEGFGVYAEGGMDGVGVLQRVVVEVIGTAGTAVVAENTVLLLTAVAANADG